MNLPGRSIRCLALAGVLAASVTRPRRQARQHGPLRLRPGAGERRSLLQQRPHRRDHRPARLGHAVYRDPNTNEYKGQLATAWQAVDDKTLEFELRQGVKFHNGEEFDADDVVYTLNFVSKPENKVITPAERQLDRPRREDRQVQSAHHHQAACSRRRSSISPARLSSIRNEYYAKVGPKGMNEKPVGTGPYRVAEHAPGKFDPPRAQPRLLQGQPEAAAEDRQGRDPLHPRPRRPRWPRCCPAASI